jgi:hypothetical protein
VPGAQQVYQNLGLMLRLCASSACILEELRSGIAASSGGAAALPTASRLQQTLGEQRLPFVASAYERLCEAYGCSYANWTK